MGIYWTYFWYVVKSHEQDKFDTSNDICTQTNGVSTTNNDDDDSFATTKDVMSRIDSQSTLGCSYRTTHTSANELRISFGCKQISHMKQVMKDTTINNNDHVSLDTNTDDNTKHDKVRKVVLISMKKQTNNGTSTQQSEKITQI